MSENMFNLMGDGYIDLTAAHTILPKIRYILDGFPEKSVGGVIAPGATGKSFFALGVCYDLVTGQNVLGMDIQKLSADEKVGYLTLEDPRDELHKRMYHIHRVYNLETDHVVQMRQQLHIRSMRGKALVNLVDSSGTPNTIQMNELIEALKGYKLVFLDTLSRLHQANENDNGHMGTLISALEYVAEQSGCAILFLHHANKGATLAGQGGESGASRGASSITDNIRFQMNLTKLSDEEAMDYKIPIELKHKFIRVHDAKTNYKEGSSEKFLERVQGGVLQRGNMKNVTGWGDKEEGDKCQFQRG